MMEQESTTGNLDAGTTLPREKRLSLMLLGSERSGTSFIQATLNKYYGISDGNEFHWVIHG